MRFATVVILISIALIFYLSWIPNPELKSVWFIPKWLAKWTDSKANENIRTAVPFVVAGLCAVYVQSKKKRSVYILFITCIALIGVVLIAELGQLALPKRIFNWADVFWGGMGSLLGILCAETILRARR